MLDLIPLIAFFAAYKIYGTLAATWTLMISVTLVSLIQKIRGELPHWQLFITSAVWVFGLMTLYFNEPHFLMWKPSFIFGIFSLVLLINHLQKKDPLMQKLMGHALDMEEKGWIWLNASWCLYFALEAILNAVVATFMTFDSWVTFKVIGLTVMTGLFILIQMSILTKRFACTIKH